MRKHTFVFTLFSSLGDFIVMGDLIQKIEKLLPGSQCLAAHRNNPHVTKWKYPDPQEHFFNIYNPKEFYKLLLKLRSAKKEGYTVLGLQQAPGSLQGFSFLKFLQCLGGLDYTADFNLYNADIVTPPDGTYILDRHLNQIRDICKIDIPATAYQLELPITFTPSSKGAGGRLIGIHPWSRRGHLSCFVWPRPRWVELIKTLLQDPQNNILIFGKDPAFDSFKETVRELENSQRIQFKANTSVADLISTIDALDLLVSVNTSVVHIGNALKKDMVILCGPTFDLWIPKGERIKTVQDAQASFPGSDKYINDDRFPSIDRIRLEDVVKATNALQKSS